MLDDFEDDANGDEFDEFDEFDEEETPSEEASNRTFIIAVGILGGLTLLSIIVLGIFILSQRSGGNRAAQETELAIAQAQQTQLELAAQQTHEAETLTAAPTDTPLPSATPPPTEVVARATSSPITSAEDPRTATVSALLTSAALVTPADTPTTFPTELPDTGFADDVGIPGLLGLAALAVLIIIIARRLRAVTG